VRAAITSGKTDVALGELGMQLAHCPATTIFATRGRPTRPVNEIR
jgi:hypothetical protein